MDENITSVVDHAFNDNASDMRDALYNAINDKIFAALEQRKQQIAQNLISQQEVEYEEEQSEEQTEEIPTEQE